jgi:hypothetical protein
MPEVYREQKNVKHQLSMDDAFLRFLDQMDEQAKLDRAHKAKVIEHQPSTEPYTEIQSPVPVEIVLEDQATSNFDR